MATDMSSNEYIYESSYLRIRDIGASYAIEYSFAEGRDDLQGAGYVMRVQRFEGDRGKGAYLARGGEDVIAKAARPIVLRYGNLYGGGSKYSYQKGQGGNGLIVIKPDGTAEDVKLIAAKSALAEAQAQPKPMQRAIVQSVERPDQRMIDEFVGMADRPSEMARCVAERARELRNMSEPDTLKAAVMNYLSMSMDAMAEAWAQIPMDMDWPDVRTAITSAIGGAAGIVASVGDAVTP